MPRNDEELRGPSCRSRGILKREWASRMGSLCCRTLHLCCKQQSWVSTRNLQRVSLRWIEWCLQSRSEERIWNKKSDVRPCMRVCPIEWFYGSLVSTDLSQVFIMHLDIRVSRSWASRREEWKHIALLHSVGCGLAAQWIEGT